MTILKVEHLSKTYKTGKQALVDLNFAVQDGEILGFLILYHAGRIGGDAVVPAVVAVHVDFVE